MANLKFLKRIGYSNINTLDDDDSAFFYASGMEIDADGAYHAYNPDGKSGLDYLANAGHPDKPVVYEVAFVAPELLSPVRGYFYHMRRPFRRD